MSVSHHIYLGDQPGSGDSPPALALPSAALRQLPALVAACPRLRHLKFKVEACPVHDETEEVLLRDSEDTICTAQELFEPLARLRSWFTCVSAHCGLSAPVLEFGNITAAAHSLLLLMLMLPQNQV